MAEQESPKGNRIHDDAIWRQRIKTELGNAEDWYKMWGFTKDLYPKTLERVRTSKAPVRVHLEQSEFKSGLPSKQPEGLAKEGELASDLLLTHQIKRLMKTKFPYEKYSVPCTASMDLGWAWGPNSKPGDRYKLERFGREARGKVDVKKIYHML